MPEVSAPPSYKEATFEIPPYPTNDATGMPFPTSRIGGTNSSPIAGIGGGRPPSIGINIPPNGNISASTPPGATVPLNTYSSSQQLPVNTPNITFRPVSINGLIAWYSFH